jgi:putative SOS response-associated peptidase YedK
MFPPGFKKPLNELPTSFNARAEEIATKPFWRGAFRGSRCLIPATGWREFSGTAGHKQPYHFHLGRKLFAFAGVSAEWTSADGEIVDSYAIVTTAANDTVAEIHDRMPLVLPAASYSAWLDPGVDPVPVLEEACRENVTLPLDVYASDPIANSGRYEGPLAIAPLSAAVTVAKPPEPVQQSLFGDDTANAMAERRADRRRSR